MLICERYEATGGMNAGGMSQVHMCNDVRLNRKVMLKTLNSAEEHRRLDDERKALLKIRSNHVVQLLDIVEFESMGQNRTCLVLENIEGEDLQEGSYDPDSKFVSHLWQVAKGLQEVHEAGLVHRDIKPNNIRIDEEGIVKIIDFGLSREVGIDNKTNSAIGYFPYMAPELFAAPPVNFTAATDVYSFGVLALALGRLGLPECLKSMNPVIPPALAGGHLAGLDTNLLQTIQQCLEHDAGDRPTMTQIVASLERVLLRNLHRARVVIGGKSSVISRTRTKAQPNISVNKKMVAKIEIEYDGNDFVVGDIVGQVDINNIRATKGDVMPMSCVLAFHYGQNQLYATFDASIPEFMP